MINQDYDTIFFDKRDEKYFKMSPNDILFFDIFSKKKLKCQEKIPETLCFINGFPKLWFFNSTKNSQENSILKKNPENIKDHHILTKFLNM